jgi:hypothetical protein
MDTNLSIIAEKGIVTVDIIRKEKIAKLLDSSIDKIQEVLDNPDLSDGEKLTTAQTAVNTVNTLERIEIEKRKATVLEGQLILDQQRIAMLPNQLVLTQQNNTVNINQTGEPDESLLLRKTQQAALLERLLHPNT